MGENLSLRGAARRAAHPGPAVRQALEEPPDGCSLHVLHKHPPPIYLKGRPALKFNLAPARLKEHRTLVYHEEKKKQALFYNCGFINVFEKNLYKINIILVNKEI